MHQTSQLSSNRPVYTALAKRIVPIAPAPDRKYLTLNLTNDMEKKQYNYKSNSYPGPQAVSIARRNARERNRVKQVNDSFNALRKRLPVSVISALSSGSRRGSGKKLSKVDTLKMVVEYIKYLQTLLNESDAQTLVQSMEKDIDEGFMCGSNSSYEESVPSPVDSDCSSGGSVSGAAYFANGYQTNDHQFTHMEDDELFETITWWQQK